MDHPKRPSNLDLFGEPPAQRGRLRVIPGSGQVRQVRIRSRSDLATILVGAAADLMLKRISVPRAHEIEKRVERLIDLFDRLEQEPLLARRMQRELADLEKLVRESATRKPGTR